MRLCRGLRPRSPRASQVKRDRDSVGYVQTADRPRQFEAADSITQRSRSLPEAFAFSAKNERQLVIGEDLLKPLFAGRVEPESLESGVADLLQRSRQIANGDQRQEIQRTRGRLGEDPGLGWGVARSCYHRIGSQRRGCPQDCPDIVRIGYLVEQHDEARLARKVRKVKGVKRLHLHGNTLMYRFRSQQFRQFLRRRAVNGKTRVDRIWEPTLRVLSRQQAQNLSARIGQRCGDGMDAIEPQTARLPGVSRAGRAAPCVARARCTMFVNGASH